MIVLLDNGHGSLINGKYQTGGKRKNWQDKGIIYEGEFNRAIVNGIIEQLTFFKIPFVK
jgi:N-acetylmuramoyl-L-alanine amidase